MPDPYCARMAGWTVQSNSTCGFAAFLVSKLSTRFSSVAHTARSLLNLRVGRTHRHLTPRTNRAVTDSHLLSHPYRSSRFCIRISRRVALSQPVGPFSPFGRIDDHACPLHAAFLCSVVRPRRRTLGPQSASLLLTTRVNRAGVVIRKTAGLQRAAPVASRSLR
ncbi:hypothetical protein FKP32DRAFT_880863 [Trametes sanguinea]|nr:hypothetical protein FKP32DRAFT_880863 [Trametes sanguinea]